MTKYADYKYSITVHSLDLAVIYCLRALSQFSQKSGNNRVPWGGTKEKDWQRHRCHVTFRFNRPEYRKGFIDEATRLLPNGSWKETKQSNNDPAKPAD